MNQASRTITFGVILGGVLCAASSAQNADWSAYNGGVDGDHYSSLTQINRKNVQKLQVAWTFDTGDKGDIEANPLIVDATLYTTTPSGKVVAVDAANGKLKWTFDSGIRHSSGRGVSYWTDGSQGRIFTVARSYLYCLDAATGKAITGFGEQGRIDMRKGLREPFERQSVTLSTPGIVYKDLIIVGSQEPETHPAPPGDIRAYDVHTGEMRWIFHTIPQPGEPGYETWPADAWKTAGAANNWAGMALDAARGIVYVPTGSAVMDFYGGDRVGNDLYSDCLLALDASSGKLLWYFQGVHHDLWDRDFPAPPALYTVKQDGKAVPAVAQTSKQGYLYLFNGLTGKPMFPIHEHPYAASTVPGEVASPTQPTPDWPLPYARQNLTEDMLTTRTPEVHAWAVQQFHTMRNGGPFYPLALNQQTIIFPGVEGGGEWGGPAVDPKTDTLYIDANDMAWTNGLAEPGHNAGRGEDVYQQQCAACHGRDRAGSPPDIPSLIDIGKRMDAEQVANKIRQGGGRMPAMTGMQNADIQAVVRYLETGATGGPGSTDRVAPADKYVGTGSRVFLDPDGYPAVQPPWGTLSAIDLKTGKYLWKIPLGEYPDLVKQGIRNTGSDLFGGPIVTAGGVLFIGATVHDRKFHAFDARTGKLLWETLLPFAGMATPSTYMIDGRQYVVIAASGGRDRKQPVGGSYVAFALPR